jgi:HD-GYP domain-containing protein (c-di-GMP phosphodiesterase class II)
MIHHGPRPFSPEPAHDDARSEDVRGDLAQVSIELADAAHALVPSCTAAVAVEVGSRWQLLAQTGSVDVASDWRGTLAASSGGGDGPRQGEGYAVAVIPVGSFRALLILVGESDSSVPARALESVGGLLAEGAERLEDARAAQQRDRAARRIESLSRRHTEVRPSRVTDQLETAVAGLWPHAVVSFYDLGARKDAPSSTRRLAQTAYDLDNPVFDDAPAARRLLPATLTYRFAIPFRARRGALIVQVLADGEAIDNESVAVAHALARAAELRDHERSLTTEVRTLRREDPATGCAPGDVLAVHLERSLRDNGHGDVALLLIEIDPESAEHELEHAAVIGEALADAVRRERAVVFRVQPWRFAVVLAGTGSREAFLIAQRLRLAVRHAGADSVGCTAAIGIALAPVNGAEASELIDAAEQAMYTTEAISRDASVATTRGRRATGASDVFGRVDALRMLKRLADENFHGGRAHSDAVAARAVRIATAMHLDAAMVQAIQLASEVAEAGSLLIRDGALHPSLPSGVLGLDSIAATLSERLLRACGFAEAAEIVASVDERYDGTGTPRGFAGNAIPIGARILAVARDVETTLEGRPLDAGALQTACTRLEAHSSRVFDPYVVQVAIRTAEPSGAGRVPLSG